VVRVAQERALARADVSNLPAQEGARIARATEAASVNAFHTGMAISATLVGLGGILGLALVRTPRRRVTCAGCAGGQLAGAPLDAARERVPVAAPA
jgi:hypothetical protein